MDPALLLQIIIGICFIGIIAVLFLENQDYLTYSILFVLIIGLATLGLRGFSEEEAEGIAMAVDWEVIIFLICLFTIVEILNEKQVFHQLAVSLINRFAFHPRRLFYALCITTTMIATVIEDLSVAIIFIPIVIQACKGIKISPIPYMYGVTICINLASTLTPFGSAENIIIANRFNLSLHWYLVHLGVYFVVAFAITLFLIDRIILTRYLKDYYYDMYAAIPGYFDYEHIPGDHPFNPDPNIPDAISQNVAPKNIIKTPRIKKMFHFLRRHHISEDLLKNARWTDVKKKVLRKKKPLVDGYSDTNIYPNESSTSNSNATAPLGFESDIRVIIEDNELEQLMEQREIAHNPNILSSIKHTSLLLADDVEKVEVFAVSTSFKPKEYRKNVVGLILFTIILMTITKIAIAGILGLSIFVFLNPITNNAGRKIPSVSHYLKRIDAKLIYFFTLLFIAVYFMDLAEITLWIDLMIERWAHHNLLRISIGILILTSVISGFLDNAPITIMFLPIISNILTNFNHPGNPLFIAFTLGINLGGNFLPQGAACDMMTLELAKKHQVDGFTYRSLTIVGGLFALLHILLGIGYIYLYITLMGY